MVIIWKRCQISILRKEGAILRESEGIAKLPFGELGTSLAKELTSCSAEYW